ncbi:TIGR03086 family metal-binding protein [Cryptosporangium aurantiacum]|uniref:TIGR03086 family protein n=1 Tax=Cryptosporangium aurantiacum TaxID=134849 RepID=A0A1M7QTL3_9ACTN|nr:TIGR03086 family metal-binding protein [Cryptosporangium aurantiacum]SHN35164.1 TIGR03086 family protein [Cryptosporangium aurantiacum]
MLIDWEIVRDIDARAVRYSVEQVDAVTTGDLGRPTPCVGWSLADLLGHLIAQHRGFAAAAAGHGADLTQWAVPSIGDDVVQRYRSAADDVLAAFAALEAPDRPVHLPEFQSEPFPAVAAVNFHAVDYLVHAWDVAATLGRPFAPDDALVNALLPLVLAIPNDAEQRAPGSPFAPALPAPADASPLERVLTALGRSPEWRPTAPHA